MRFLLAPDKFKGCLNALQVAEQIALGIRKALPDAEIELAPVADGGEGTAGIILRARDGEWVTSGAHDPLGREISARYAWLPDDRTAVMEMSETAGMALVQSSERDLLRANTFGVGEMLLDAAARGAREVIVGLGGSATNDGGFGFARALGFRFFGDESGHAREFRGGVDELIHLQRIDRPELHSLPSITAAADVRNPLLGRNGATAIFGPQKGASADEIELMERLLTRLADVSASDLGCDFRDHPGAGAAGGLGFGLMTFGGATVRAGFEIVAETIQLQRKISWADIVITGEGRLDQQTLAGKAPAGVARLARAAGKKIFAIVGQASDEVEQGALFDGIIPLTRSAIRAIPPSELTARMLREGAEKLALSLRGR
ncbi:MAG: glycerate kinase [Verrucomicrobiota bacterium]